MAAHEEFATLNSVSYDFRMIRAYDEIVAFIERYAQQHREWTRAAMLDAQKRVNDASLEEVSVEGLPIPI